MDLRIIQVCLLVLCVTACTTVESPDSTQASTPTELPNSAIVTPEDESITEELIIAEDSPELDYDLGGWPEAPLPTATLPYNGICYVVFNTQKKPFDSVLVRQAFAFSIDREDIAQNATCEICDFYNQRPAITLVPEDYYLTDSGTGLYDKWLDNDFPQLESYSDFYQKWLDDQWYNELLAAGHKPEEISFELLTSNENVQIADRVAQNWREYLGVAVELAGYEPAEFNEAVTGSEPPAAYVTCNYMDLASPSDLLIGLVSGYYGDYIRWEPTDAYNRAVWHGYQNNDIDAYLQAENMLVGEQAVIAPLFYYHVE